MRRYASLYPEEVAGVVLIDPMRSEQWPPFDPAKQSQIDLGCRLIRFAIPVASSGFARLMVSLLFSRASHLSDHIAGAAGAHKRHVLTRLKTEVRKMPRKVWPAVAAHWSRPGFYAGIRSHLKSIPDTVTEMDAAEPIREIPVTVLTPGNTSPLTQEHLDRIGDRTQQVFAERASTGSISTSPKLCSMPFAPWWLQRQMKPRSLLRLGNRAVVIPLTAQRIRSLARAAQSQNTLDFACES